MATSLISRSLLSKSLTTLFTRTFKTSALSLSPPRPSLSLLNRLRPLAAAANLVTGSTVPPNLAARAFSTRPTSSSLNDPNPNWSNRPPKETIMLDGCDFEHWLVVLDKPEGDVTRDDIIDMYIKTLAKVVGSEEEARMKIYSVSTRCYFAFGANVSEEISYKLKDLPGVRWVLPDSYLDVRNKDYGGEPFINGQAVPYDPKYHEEWIRNNIQATNRNKKNDRPRSFDRSRNFERRRDNMRAAPNMGGMPPQNNMGGMPPQNNMGGMPPQNSMGGMPPQNNMGGMPPQNNMGGMPPQNNMRGMPPQNNMGGMPPQNNMGGMPQHNMPQHNNMGGMPPNMAGLPPNAGWSGNMQNYQNSGPNPGGIPYQGATPNTQFQNNYTPNRDGPSGNPY